MKRYLKEASLGMALMDALPVLFFCGIVVLLGMLWRSPLFGLGGICCILAGAGKVLWKLVLALVKRNLLVLNRQFRYLMSCGFFLIIAALAVDHRRISMSLIWKNVTWFPGNICFVIGICGMALMMVLAVKMDHSSKKANWLEQSVNLAAQLAIFLGVLLIWYGNSGYQADGTAVDALQSTDTASVTELENGRFFDGAGEDTALIFYPGARVEYTAYAPLMQLLAGKGVDCFLLEMPYNLAIFGIDRAQKILETYAYDNWYLAGHSLGGAMAANFASSHSNELTGLILLAAYSASELPEVGLKVLTLYGSEDGVLNREKLEAGAAYLPENALTVCMEGGNHAGFGSYGEQAGDKEASITQEDQWMQTAEAICAWIEEP